MNDPPSTNGSNGARAANGQFAKGNKGGPGNPHAKRVARARTVIFDAVSEDDLRAIFSALIDRAKQGDLVAIRELLDRLVGRPATAIDPEQRKLLARQLELREQQIEAQEDRFAYGG